MAPYSYLGWQSGRLPADPGGGILAIVRKRMAERSLCYLPRIDPNIEPC